ncbi:MAG: lysophospholipid acyltransferase family protein [Chitinophagaceae bacterium]
MKFLLKVLQVLYSIYAMLSFALLLLVIFPFVIVASFFGKVNGGNMIYRICSAWSDLWFLLIGLRSKKIQQTAAPLKGAHYIFVANHISYMDIPMIVKIIRQPTRPLGKAEIAKVPLFGYLYRNAAVMVDRSSPENRKKSVLQLKSILKRGISVFIFPEGTFNTSGKTLKEFYDGAFRIAIETQTPLLPVIFPDTVKRLHYKSPFTFTPGVCRAIFLEEVPVEGLTADDLPLLKEHVHAMMEKALEEVDSRRATVENFRES